MTITTYGMVIGRIFKATTSPVGTPWMWTLAYGDHEDRKPTHGYEATRAGAMQAFARSWHRETRSTAIVRLHSLHKSSILLKNLSG